MDSMGLDQQPALKTVQGLVPRTAHGSGLVIAEHWRGPSDSGAQVVSTCF